MNSLPVVGFEYRYVVTESGTVISRWRRTSNGAIRHTPIELRPTTHRRTGHRRVVLYSEAGRRCSLYVHVLVAEAWVGPRPDWTELIRHLDGNPANNSAENLTYGTHVENCVDRAHHRRERLFLNEAWWDDLVWRFSVLLAGGVTFAGLDFDVEAEGSHAPQA